MTAFSTADHLTAATEQAIDTLDRILNRIHRADPTLTLERESDKFWIVQDTANNLTMFRCPSFETCDRFMRTFAARNPGVRILEAGGDQHPPGPSPDPHTRREHSRVNVPVVIWTPDPQNDEEDGDEREGELVIVTMGDDDVSLDLRVGGNTIASAGLNSFKAGVVVGLLTEAARDAVA